jgi:hypothetical protein
MEQPLDLSIPNHDLIKKKTFTIEYLTSDIPNQVRSPLIRTNQSFNPYLNPPLHPVENQLNNNYQYFSLQNEHVVPNICSPPLTVSNHKEDVRFTSFFLLEWKFRNGQWRTWNKKSFIRLRN